MDKLMTTSAVMIYGEGRRGGWITGSWKVSVVERRSSIFSVSGTELYFSVGNLNMTLSWKSYRLVERIRSFRPRERSASANISNVQADIRSISSIEFKILCWIKNRLAFPYLSAT
jgi:hypothetical protein